MTVSTSRPRSTMDRSAGSVQPTVPLWFTSVLAGVLVASTLYGLLTAGAYRVSPGVRETLPETLRGQDLLTLLIVPVLVWTAIRARAGSLRAHVVWLALLLYVAYSYLMYVVAPFNDAFLLYVAAIGLAGYGLLNGLVRIDVRAAGPAFADVPRRALAVFLIAVGTLFVGLWLAQILPALGGGVPEDLFVYDIPSTVHVLDLAVVLPLTVATGVLLLRQHAAAPILATLLLVKMITLGLALLSMNAFVAAGGGGVADPTEPIIWGIITLVGSAWLMMVLRRVHPPAHGWLRPTFWPMA